MENVRKLKSFAMNLNISSTNTRSDDAGIYNGNSFENTSIKVFPDVNRYNALYLPPHTLVDTDTNHNVVLR